MLSKILMLMALHSLLSCLQAFPHRPEKHYARIEQETAEESQFLEASSNKLSPRPHIQRANYPSFPRFRQYPSVLQGSHPRASTQAVSILNCGPDGDLIHNILQSALGALFFLFPDAAEVTVNCDFYGDGRCTAVTVEVPVGTIRADVDVCVENGNVCVTVYANGQPCPPLFSIPIPIPQAGGSSNLLTININTLLGCASVELNAPACSA